VEASGASFGWSWRPAADGAVASGTIERAPGARDLLLDYPALGVGGSEQLRSPASGRLSPAIAVPLEALDHAVMTKDQPIEGRLTSSLTILTSPSARFLPQLSAKSVEKRSTSARWVSRRVSRLRPSSRNPQACSCRARGWRPSPFGSTCRSGPGSSAVPPRLMPDSSLSTPTRVFRH
jgi:hypothetical protein